MNGCAVSGTQATLTAVGDAQRGRVNTQQLLALGWNDDRIRTATHKGVLKRLRRGVYAIGHLNNDRLAAETEALLAVGVGSVLVAQSVLAAHELMEAPPEVHVAARAKSRPGIRVHRYSQLADADVRVISGLLMTTVERALLDSAPELSDRQLERLLDEALYRRLTSRTKVAELLRRSDGREGQARLARLNDRGRPGSRTESPPQEEMLALLRQAHLPTEPETEVRMAGYRLDFYFREARLAVEVDPFGSHDARRKSHGRDRRKDRILRDQGIEVVRVTPDDMGQRPLEIIAHIAGEVARRKAA